MTPKESAIDILASNPSMERVFVAKDGSGWATEKEANTHNRSLGYNVAMEENQAEEFTRKKLSKDVDAFAAELAEKDAAAKAYAAELAEMEAAAKTAAREVLLSKQSELEAAAKATEAAAAVSTGTTEN